MFKHQYIIIITAMILPHFLWNIKQVLLQTVNLPGFQYYIQTDINELCIL